MPGLWPRMQPDTFKPQLEDSPGKPRTPQLHFAIFINRPRIAAVRNIILLHGSFASSGGKWFGALLGAGTALQLVIVRWRNWADVNRVVPVMLGWAWRWAAEYRMFAPHSPPKMRTFTIEQKLSGRQHMRFNKVREVYVKTCVAKEWLLFKPLQCSRASREVLTSEITITKFFPFSQLRTALR